jgi:hypothetical protein
MERNASPGKAETAARHVATSCLLSGGVLMSALGEQETSLNRPLELDSVEGFCSKEMLGGY